MHISPCLPLWGRWQPDRLTERVPSHPHPREHTLWESLNKYRLYKKISKDFSLLIFCYLIAIDSFSDIIYRVSFVYIIVY